MVQMADPIYCTCGALLVEEVTAAGVRPPGGDAILPFRRTTDHVICGTCFQSYDVRSLIAQAQSKDVIDHLERLAEEAQTD